MANGGALKIQVPDEGELKLAILRGVASVISRAIRQSLVRIRERMNEVIANAVRGCPEYKSLVEGKLRGELGVVDAAPVLNAVIRNLSSGLVITDLGVQVVGTRLQGGLRIEMVKSDYSEVLVATGGSFRSEGGFQIPWLQWLTIEGDRLLVLEHRFVSGASPRSRTGLGVMSRGGQWRVPAAFAGTMDNNWLTRALVKTASEIERVVSEEINRNL